MGNVSKKYKTVHSKCISLSLLFIGKNMDNVIIAYLLNTIKGLCIQYFSYFTWCGKIHIMKDFI